MVLNKGHDLFMGWHEVCATMLSDQDCATGIRQACSLVPVPPVDQAVQETRGKCVTSAQDIFDLHREPWHLNLRSNISSRYKMNRSAGCLSSKERRTAARLLTQTRAGN